MAVPAGVGVSLPFGGQTLRESLATARLAETLGYAAVWTSERDGWDAVGHAGALSVATRRCAVGVAVLSVFSRPPALIAMGAAGLQDLSDGRLLLGLGASAPALTTGLLGLACDRPATRVAETVDLVRRALTGGRVEAVGEMVRMRGRITLPVRRPVPLLLAAAGPRLLALAGARADGVLLNQVPPAGIAAALAPVRAAATAAGRPEPPAVLTVPVATDPDPERGRVEVVRLGLAYATAPAYAAQLRRAGLGDALDAAQARRAAGDLEGAVAAAGERLLGAFGLWGTPSSVAAGVAAYRRAGVSCVNVHLLPPASGAGEGHYREWLDALAGEFGPELASGALTGAGA